MASVHVAIREAYWVEKVYEIKGVTKAAVDLAMRDGEFWDLDMEEVDTLEGDWIEEFGTSDPWFVRRDPIECEWIAE